MPNSVVAHIEVVPCRACERSGERSGASRKSREAERSGERAWQKTMERQRSGEQAESRAGGKTPRTPRSRGGGSRRPMLRGLILRMAKIFRARADV